MLIYEQLYLTNYVITIWDFLNTKDIVFYFPTWNEK